MKPGGVMRLSEFSNNYDFERFGTQPVAAQEHVLAMSTHSHLLLSHVGGVLDLSSTGCSATNSTDGTDTTTSGTFEQPVISRIAIEYSDKDPNDRINTIVWITAQVLACGFESGLVQGYAENGDRLFQFVGPAESSVTSIKTTIEGPEEEILWIMFEKGTLLAVPLSQALQNNFTEAVIISLKQVQQANDFILATYVETAAQSFALFDPQPLDAGPASTSSQRTNKISNNTVPDTSGNMNTWSPSMKRLVVIGGQATMSLYHIDLWSILSNERKRIQQAAASTLSASSLTKSFFSMVSSITGSSTNGSEEEEQDPAVANTFSYFVVSKKRQCRDLTPVTTVLLDEKRRMIRMSVDPLGGLCACADGLGRVTLFDLMHIYQGHIPSPVSVSTNPLASGGSKKFSSSTYPIAQDAHMLNGIQDAMSQQFLLPIRLWKGVRDAHFGWIIESDTVSVSNSSLRSHKHASSALFATHACVSHAVNNNLQLRLAIFAPQLGLVSIYQMRNGPCVRVIPVGFNVRICKLLQPVLYEARNALETVVVLRSDSHQKSVEVLSLASTAQSESQLAILVDLMMDESGDSTNPRSPSLISDSFFSPSHELLQDDMYHGDIHASIQEAWLGLQQAQQLHPNRGHGSGTAVSLPEIAIPWQLSRLLRMFYVQQVQAFGTSASPVPPVEPTTSSSTVLPNKVESAILKLLTRVSTISQYLQLLQVLQVCELLQFIMYQSYALPPPPYFFYYHIDSPTNEHISQATQSLRDIEDNLILLLDASYMQAHHPALHALYRNPSSTSPSHHKPTAQKPFIYPLPMLVSGTHAQPSIRMVVKFSVEFHQESLRLLENLVSSSAGEGISSTLLNQIQQDISEKRQMLDIYRVACSLQRQITRDATCLAVSSTTSGTSLPVAVQEEAATICRQPSYRAEALCWTMRAYKLASTSTTSTGIARNNAPNSANTTPNQSGGHRSVSVSPLPAPVRGNAAIHRGKTGSAGAVSPSPPTIPLSPNSPIDDGHNSSLVHNRQRNRMLQLRETIQWQQQRQVQQSGSLSPALPSLSSPIQQSSHSISNSHQHLSGSTHNSDTISAAGMAGTLLREEDPVQLSFSSFVLFFAYVSGSSSSLEPQRRLLTHLLLPGYICSSDSVSSCTASTSVRDVLGIGESNLSTAAHTTIAVYLDDWTRQAMRQLLCLPLFGDLVTLHEFNSIMKRLDGRLSGPLGMQLLLPAVLQLLDEQSASVLVADLLVKKNNTSPLQRWIRDQLLTFQVTLTEFHHVHESAVSSPTHEATTALASGDLRGERYSGVQCMDALQLCERFTSDLVKKRRSVAVSGNGAETASDIGFEEYVQLLWTGLFHRLRRSAALEANLSFLALILETLHAVNDQIERRTYGKEGVSRVIQQCEDLFRQTRVLLLLKSRTMPGAHSIGLAINNVDDEIDDSDGGGGGGRGSLSDKLIAQYVDWNLSPMDAVSAPSMFTIHHLESAHISLYRILAQDSLDFGYRVTAAMEHEERCRDVFLHALRQQEHQQQQQQLQAQLHSIDESFALGNNPANNNNAAGVSSASTEVLLAWGKTADKRWRDLLSLALTEDAIHATASATTATGASISANSASSANNTPALDAMRRSVSTVTPSGSNITNNNSGSPLPTTSSLASTANAGGVLLQAPPPLKRKRKPLLLYFPYHNHPVLLGAYRAVITASHWAQQPHKSDGLVVVCEHLFEIDKPWRGLVAYEIYMRYIFPVYQGLVCLEEENSGSLYFGTSQSTTSLSPSRKNTATNSNKPKATSDSKKDSQTTTSSIMRFDPLRAQQLMQLMKDPALVKSLVTNTVEVLTYILETYSQVSTATPTTPFAPELPLSESARRLFSDVTNSNGSNMDEAGNNSTSGNANGNNNKGTWPWVADFTFGHLPQRFTSWVHHTGYCRDVVQYHICVAYTLCLRFQCALRGVAPSVLLGRRLSLSQFQQVQRFVQSADSASNSEFPLSVLAESSNPNASLNDEENEIGVVGEVSGEYVELLHEVWLSSNPATYRDANVAALHGTLIRHCLLHNDLAQLPTRQIQARGQFLLLGFRRMMWLLHQQKTNVLNASSAGVAGGGNSGASGSAEVRPQILYHLGKLWGFPLDVIRVFHVQVLLEQGEDVQNEVENMVCSQFDDVRVIMDALLSYVRYQLGTLLLTVEALPQYGPVLAAMDAEALLWAKQSAIYYGGNSSSTRNLIASAASKHAAQMKVHASGLPRQTKSPLASSGTPTSGSPSTSSLHTKHMYSNNPSAAGATTALHPNNGSSNNGGETAVVDIAVIRRVVLYLQTLLLNVPLKDRTNPNVTTGTTIGGGGASSDQATAAVPAYANWASRYLPLPQLSSGSNNNHATGSSSASSSSGAGASNHMGGYVSMLQMTVYHSWWERKSRCDALLSLCNAIVTATLKLQQHIQQQQQLRHSAMK